MSETPGTKRPSRPLGRWILLLVAVIAVALAIALQGVGVLVARRNLEAAHRQTAVSTADLMAARVTESLLTDSIHELPDLLAVAKQTGPGILYVVVCNRDGVPVAHLPADPLAGDLEDMVLARSVPDQGETAFNVRTEQGDVLHLVRVLEKGKVGYLHIGFSWASVDEALRVTCLHLFLAMAAGLLVSIFFAWYAYRRLARPLVELTGAAREIGGGKLDARVPVTPRSWDEAAILGEAFNQMAGRIQEQVTDLVASRSALSDEKTRVQAILDSMVQSVIVTGTDGKTIYCNRAARSLWGCECKKRARAVPAMWGCQCAQPCVNSGKCHEKRAEPLRAFREASTEVGMPFRMHQRVGDRDLAIVIAPVLGPYGESLGTVEIASDVTEQVHAWRALAHAEKLNVVGQLAAGVAHEINSPLDGAIEASKILERSAGQPEKVRRFAQAQRMGLERIAMIVRRLLTFSRRPNIQSRGMVAVSKLIEEAHAILRHRLAKGAVSLKAPEPSETQALYVRGDELSLVQVLVNLLNNAIDVSPEGGTVEIGVRTEGGSVEISVTDQGTGVSDAVARRLFTPFFTTKEIGKGTGLGLAVSRNIVEEHGGAIEFANVAPRGARFVIRLPSPWWSGGGEPPAAPGAESERASEKAQEAAKAPVAHHDAPK